MLVLSLGKVSQILSFFEQIGDGLGTRNVHKHTDGRWSGEGQHQMLEVNCALVSLFNISGFIFDAVLILIWKNMRVHWVD